MFFFALVIITAATAAPFSAAQKGFDQNTHPEPQMVGAALRQAADAREEEEEEEEEARN